jgi:hypothetical protein
MIIANISMNPITDVTLENGKTSLFTKKFKYDRETPEKEIKFHPQLETASIF